MIAPELSVVLVSWNSGDSLSASLSALRRSAAANAQLEIVVVDNGSTDDSRRLAADAGADVIVENPLNPGYVVAASQGIGLARSEWIMLANPDLTVSEDFVSLVSLRADTGSGPLEVAGTLLGKKNAMRVIQVWDFEVEIEPSEHMIFVIYEDRPGIIGTVGTILGEHGINIATMEVGRKSVGGEALIGLTVDSPVPAEVLASIADAIDANLIRAVTMSA